MKQNTECKECIRLDAIYNQKGWYSTDMMTGERVESRKDIECDSCKEKRRLRGEPPLCKKCAELEEHYDEGWRSMDMMTGKPVERKKCTVCSSCKNRKRDRKQGIYPAKWEYGLEVQWKE